MVAHTDLAEKKPNLITPADMRLINSMPNPSAALASVQQHIERGAQTIILITTAGRMIGALVITPDRSNAA